jgi:hypothetical protein
MIGGMLSMGSQVPVAQLRCGQTLGLAEIREGPKRDSASNAESWRSRVIVLKARRTDGITGFSYSVGLMEREPIITTDVMEAVHLLEELGVENPDEAVEQVRKRGILHIHEHNKRPARAPARRGKD